MSEWLIVDSYLYPEVSGCFRMQIYGPRGNTDSKIEFFPGIVDGISEGRKGQDEQATIRHEIWRAARAIQRAASTLRGDLT